MQHGRTRSCASRAYAVILRSDLIYAASRKCSINVRFNARDFWTARTIAGDHCRQALNTPHDRRPWCTPRAALLARLTTEAYLICKINVPALDLGSPTSRF